MYDNLEYWDEDKDTQKEFDHVELILKDAQKHGMKYEVEKSAVNMLKSNPYINMVKAYETAFKQWVK